MQPGCEPLNRIINLTSLMAGRCFNNTRNGCSIYNIYVLLRRPWQVKRDEVKRVVGSKMDTGSRLGRLLCVSFKDYMILERGEEDVMKNVNEQMLVNGAAVRKR